MRISLQTSDPGLIKDLLPDFEPENELEARVTRDPDLLEGLAWGEPRAGHPEGAVARHVEHLLDRLDTWEEPAYRREKLRFMALVHDSFKADVWERLPKIGRNHHADRARRFAERYTGELDVLCAIEHHDRPYNLWRKMKRKRSLDERAFTKMLGEIPVVALFVRFVELDGSTEGKNPEPIHWFRAELERRGYDVPEPPRV
jgi:hypothetical protein